jgi:hypothetical protein
MSKCPQCSAPLNKDNNCDYCGYHNPEYVKQVKTESASDIQESLDIVNDNLNALNDMHKPSIGEGIKDAFRIIFAIFTFGLILIFWRKPKKRLDKSYYHKIKGIVERNIELLNIHAEKNKDLAARLQVLKNEITKISAEIRRSIIIKQVSFWTVMVFFVVWIAYISSSDSYTLYPETKQVSGALSGKLLVATDSIEVSTYTIGDTLSEIKTTVLFEVTEAYILQDDEYAIVEIIFLDEAGVPWNYSIDIAAHVKSREDLKLGLIASQRINIGFFALPRRMFEFPAKLKKFRIESKIMKAQDLPLDTIPKM